MKSAPFHRGVAAIALAAMLSACGGGGNAVMGGGSGGGGTGGSGGAVATPTPTPTPASCSIGSRQDWVLQQMREWYLFPETLPAAPNAAAYGTLDEWVDALTATARGQGRDRYFTYVTSIAEENAFYQSGESAGFGFRLVANADGSRVFVSESYEGTPALDVGVDRGAEILAIGMSSGTLRTVASIVAAEGLAGVMAALGPSTVGTARTLRVTDAGGAREVTLTKREYDIAPVSSRTGVRIYDTANGKVGYVALRTFIQPADPALRNAFARFRAEGVRDLVVDLRYNGGGALTIAELMGDLMGADRSTSDVFDRVTFRPEKASNDVTRYFQQQPEAIAARRIAFIGTGETASASELVINAFIPYLGAEVALIGTNTFGKPVGQIALDQPACDDRLRVVALSIRNRDNQGDYYNGLGSTVRASCAAPDDISRPMGDPMEASTRTALDFLAGRSCTPISLGVSAARRESGAGTGTGARQLLTPDRPTPAQREVPGTF